MEKLILKLNSEDWKVKWEKIKRFIYNPEKRKVLGRTGKSWLRITIFYHVFFATLGAFSYTSYQIFATTLNSPENGGSPKWTLSSGLIGNNPGMGYRPSAEVYSDKMKYWPTSEYYSVVVVNTSNTTYWVNELKLFLKSYERKQSNGNVVDCDLETKRDSKTVCRVLLSDAALGKCTEKEDFGYSSGNPCVLVKLNKIYDWEPKPYGIVNGIYHEEKLKEDLEKTTMPEDLKSHIMENVQKSTDKELLLKTVWTSCSAMDTTTKEYLPENSIQYPVGVVQGFPGYFYPYKNQPGYAAPFLMVQFYNLTRSVKLKMECRAWAKNIDHHDKLNGNGKVSFQFLVQQ